MSRFGSRFWVLILAFPYIASNVALCGAGLYKTEKNAFTVHDRLPFMFVGASFVYYVVTPLAFDFFLGFHQAGTDGPRDDGNAIAGIAFQGSAQEYLSLTIKFIVAFGMCFNCLYC